MVCAASRPAAPSICSAEPSRAARICFVTTLKIYSRFRCAVARSFVVRRSSIAQLGVFAAVAIPPNTLLMEYYGQAVRPAVADIRERRCGVGLAGWRVLCWAWAYQRR